MAETTSPSPHAIAHGFVRLPPDKRRAFLDALRARGIAFSRLPVPPVASGAAETAASPAQQRLWTLSRLDPDSAAYHMPGAFRLRGDLDVGALERALTGIADRHAVLRTLHRQDAEGRLWAAVQPPRPMALGRTDLRALPAADRAAQAARLADRLIARPFDLERDRPLRADLLTLGTDEHWLVVTLHHIAADGASIPLLMAELAGGYRAERSGDAPPPAPSVQYADIAAWQAAWLDAGEAERQTAFWLDRLSGAPAQLDLPVERTEGETGGAEQMVTIAPPLAGALRALAAREGCTLFAVLLAGYAALLARLSGQDDLVVGVPAAGRRQPEAERLIGCFVNTLPLRLRPDGARSFRALVADTARIAAEAQDHQDLPFERIAEALKAERGTNPLLRVMFDHAAASPTADLPGLTVEALALPVRTAKFDLALGSVEQPDGSLLVRLAHRLDRIDAAGARRLLGRWDALLTQAAADPDQPLRALDPRTPEERRTIEGWSRDASWVPSTIPDPLPVALARHAAARPDAPAVLFGDAILTHGALDRRANRLAHQLIGLGAGPEIRVGVCLERTPDLLVALLAVLKSGAAFVPLDPTHPLERRRAIREAAGLSLLIGRERLDGLEAIPPDGTEGFPDHAPGVAIHPRSLAYLIHTSGSTGQPKGVAVEHGPLAMHCLATGALYDMTPDSRELHFLSFTFDGAHERWMTALSHGGAILLRDDSLWTVEQTYDAIRRHGVTHAGFPPKYLQQLAAWAEEQPRDPPPVWL